LRASYPPHCVASCLKRPLLTGNPPPHTHTYAQVTYTSDQLELFQVTLWASILLVVVLLAATCTLYNMEVTQDSLLFSKGKND